MTNIYIYIHTQSDQTKKQKYTLKIKTNKSELI
jgi:hypothetical protein